MKKLLAVVVLVFGALGCESWTEIQAGKDANVAPDGSIGLAVGESLRLTVFERVRGYDIQSSACGGDVEVAVSDPSVVAVEDIGAHEPVDTYSNGTITADAITITGLRAGDVTLTARCSDRVGTRTVRVR